MVEWLAGNRIKGTSTERTAGTPEVPAVVNQGGWVELGRHTFGSALETLDVSSLPDKRYYMVLANYLDSGSTAPATAWRFNADTGSNYAYRRNADGGSDSTDTSKPYMSTAYNNIATTGFEVNYISNLSSKEKLLQGHQVYQNTAGAGTAPNRVENVGKWANTSNALDQIQINTVTSGRTYGTGSEMVVLGWDDDAHTTNFWEELASVDLSGGASDSLSTGTFIPKKYMWLQWFHSSTGGTVYSKIRVGNSTIDTGSNYARRQSGDGGSDSTATGETYMFTGYTASTTPEFGNMFIINNASTEKLAIAHTNVQSTAGAGTAPSRKEMAFKWANTSNQINIIELLNDTGSGDMGTNTILKVWGSD